jgi:hypothetical protein
MYGEGWTPEADNVRTAREVPLHSEPVPTWTNAPGFDKDVFTFARIRYSRLDPRSPAVRWRGGHWYSDFPDSDLNLSYRLQQITSIKVNPDGRVVDITDPELFDYPWTYMCEPGLMQLEDDEVPILRRYLLNGGFLMSDDFWGELQWANFEREMKRVFPDRSFEDVPFEHPLFHCVYDLQGPLSKLQVPNVKTAVESQGTDVTWETHQSEVCKDLHIRAIFDDKQRIMVLACHNTDYGDGWERESEGDYFFQRFSAKVAYPMAINIIFYVMTH